MGKKSKRTRAKHQDFKKVSLKVGKRLPKGTNETVTAFKSRAIIIKEQLGTSVAQETVNQIIGSKPTTKKTYSLEDLLKKSKHCNAKMRCEALNDVCKGFTEGQFTIALSLTRVIQLASLCLDPEPTVRSALFHLFKVVFSLAKTIQLETFRDSLCAHLRCAMSHIDEGIRRDSLLFLDVFLHTCPRVIAKDPRVLSCFVLQISHTIGQKSQGGKSRTLVVDPDALVATQKWRMDVMQRLRTFLNVTYTQLKADSTGNADATERRWMHALGRGWTPRRQPGSSFSIDEMFESLSPLLMDIWLESKPDQLKSGVLPPEVFKSLCHIIGVINALFKLKQLKETTEDAHRTMFGELNTVKVVARRDYQNTFEKQFMQHFPFSVHSHGRKDKNTPLFEESPISLNLSICEILSCFESFEGAKSYVDAAILHLIDVLNHKSHQPTAQQLHVVLDIAQQQICLHKRDSQKSHVAALLGKLLTAITECYTKVNGKQKTDIIDFFVNTTSKLRIVITQRCLPNAILSALDGWFSLLPKEVCEKDVGLLEDNTRLYKVETLMSWLHYTSRFTQLASSFHTMQYQLLVIIPQYSGKLQKMLVWLIRHFGPALNNQLYRELVSLCKNPDVELRNVGYIIEELEDRQEKSERISDLYYQFVLHVLYGTPYYDEKHSARKGHHVELQLASDEMFSRAMEISVYVAASLGYMRTRDTEAVITVYLAIAHDMDKRSTFSITTVCSWAKFVTRCNKHTITRENYNNPKINEILVLLSRRFAPLVAIVLSYCHGADVPLCNALDAGDSQVELSLHRQKEIRNICVGLLMSDVHQQDLTEQHVPLITSFLQHCNHLIQRNTDFSDTAIVLRCVTYLLVEIRKQSRVTEVFGEGKDAELRKIKETLQNEKYKEVESQEVKDFYDCYQYMVCD